MSESKAVTIAEDLGLPEAPRWRAGRLYFSDMTGHRVMVTDPGAGTTEIVVALDERPGGLGWTQDGVLYIVGMDTCTLYRFAAGELSKVADLSGFGATICNDMVIDRHDRAYIGTFAIGGGATSAEKVANATRSALILVDLAGDRKPRVAAEELLLANGILVTADEEHVIVAETGAKTLTEFRIAADGTLTERTTFADLPAPPDGICLDDTGCVWVAFPMKPGGYRRIERGGCVVETVESLGGGFACALGGTDGHTLFLLEAPHPPVPPESRDGIVRSVPVSVASAGIL